MDPPIVIVGGGLAGLSAGCYARMCGFETLIVEHASEPGGVCTTWSRSPYVVDGCVHWLTGAGEAGPFRRVYEELGIIRDVAVQPLDFFERFEDPTSGWSIDLVRDPGALRRQLEALGPEDRDAVAQLFDAIEATAHLPMSFDHPRELSTLADGLRQLWEMRQVAPMLVRFRGALGHWADSHFESAALRSLFKALLSPDMPAIFLPYFLGLLGAGQLSRPQGGSGEIVGAVARRYRELGGALSLGVTVEEIVVQDGRARGVRLDDGTIVAASQVVCTSSAYETHLRLLGGRHLDRATRSRLDQWRTFDPIVLVSVGVATPLSDAPSSVVVRQREPLVVGGHPNEWVLMRIFNDAPWVAPEGHTVVQTILATDYEFWARQGSRYADAKAAVVQAVLERFEERLPAIRGAERMTDISTPLTFWRWARAWRGAYEGWLPTTDTFFAHVPKRVSGVDGLYLAGQWVEPGGGVPPALTSGRQVVQILARDQGRPFTPSVPG